MRFSPILLALPLVGAAGAGNHRRNEAPSVLTKKFILEVAPNDIDAVSAIFEAKHGAKVLKSFKTDVFNGITIESDVDNIDTLIALEKVVSAWPSRRYAVAEPLPPSDVAAKNYSIHHITGVDKLHTAGITGKGVKVAVIDTGVDYLHPALGGCFGPGCKVLGGYDFGGNTNYPYEDSIPDDDPMDQNKHGSHVAGIVAGNHDWFKGVAPDASILAYKVASGSGYIDDDWLLEAFSQAYVDGADVVTCSIGGPDGWSDGAWQAVADRLVALGVIVTISAGNDGERAGVFFPSSGSSADGVLAIASTVPTTVSVRPFTATFSVGGVENTTTLAYDPALNPDPYLQFDYLWDVQDKEIVVMSFDAAADEACIDQHDPTGLPSLAGKIALVRVEGCDIAYKQWFLEQLGAEYALFYSLKGGLERLFTGFSVPKSGVVETKTAQAIIAVLKAGGKVTANFNLEQQKTYISGELTSGGVPSYYTSWGGLYDLKIKPDIAAPGSDILSVKWSGVDGEVGGYLSISGTSMSCPYVAGVGALYVSKFGGKDVNGPGLAKTFANKVISSGNSLPWMVDQLAEEPVNYNFFAPVPQIGNGQIDAWKIFSYKSSLTFDKIVLNDTTNFQRYHKISVTNDHDVPITYSFALQPAGGFEAQSSRPHDLATSWELSPVSIVPEVTLPSRGQTLKPGETKTFNINFKPVTYADPAKLPIYSGKIIVSSSAGETLSVPYMGAAFSLKRELAHVLPEGWEGPYLADIWGQDRDVSTYDTYSFNLDTADFPIIITSLKWGSRQVRWDIFEADWVERKWSWPLVPGKNGYIGSTTYHTTPYWNGHGNWGEYDPSTVNVAAILPFPVQTFRTANFYFPKFTFAWIGTMADGSRLPPGKYTMRFAALKPFGVPERADNWDVWKSPIITITS